MVAVIEGSKAEDQIERSITVDDVARTYAHLTNCDPYQDMIIAEIGGEIVGYNRVAWEQETVGDRIYLHFGFLLPTWRGRGIGRAMLRAAERRLLQIARDHPPDMRKFFQSWAAQTELATSTLLQNEGYQAVRFAFEMVRPLAGSIPHMPLPAGLEIRLVHASHIRSIWEANNEAFQDHWGHVPRTEQDYQQWQEEPIFNPALWKVAWVGDQVAGMVLNFIDERENEEYGRKRGYTEDICVRRPWRKLGLAKALIARSLLMFQEMGFDHAALGVDTQNLTGALRLYESLGFRPVKRFNTYRKPLDQALGPR